MKHVSKLKTVRAYLQTKGRCWICGKKLTLDEDNSPTMMTTAREPEIGVIAVCAGCSRSRKGMDLEDFRLVLQKGAKKKRFFGETLLDR
jgi:hypothetical protein